MKLPDVAFRVREPKALTVILEEGLLADFPDTSGANPIHASLVFQEDHATHWIVAIHQVGQPAPFYNGYIVYGFPKRQYGIDHVKDFIKKHVSDTIDDSGYCVEGFSDPVLNRFMDYSTMTPKSRRSQPGLSLSVVRKDFSGFISQVPGGSAFYVRRQDTR